jgi:ABC-2 type transport system permease protein
MKHVSIKKYLFVFRLSALDLLEYRVDFLLRTLKYALAILMMAVLWHGIAAQEPGFGWRPVEIVTYFAWGATLYSLSNFHTSYIEEDIRLGGLTRFLTKPIKALSSYLMLQGSHVMLETGFKSLLLALWLWWSHQGVGSWSALGLLVLFVPVIFYTAFLVLSTVSLGAFWFTQIYAVRYMVMIIFRFLSGLLTPVSLMPEVLQRIIWLLPFPHWAFTPIAVLQGRMPLEKGLEGLAILCGWAVVLTLLRGWVWRMGILAYESTGQ